MTSAGGYQRVYIFLCVFLLSDGPVVLRLGLRVTLWTCGVAVVKFTRQIHVFYPKGFWTHHWGGRLPSGSFFNFFFAASAGPE